MSPRFVDPPGSIYRAPRTKIDAGLLAVFGIVLAVLFLLLLLGMLETGLGVRFGNVFRPGMPTH